MHIKFRFKFVIKIPKHTAKALQKSEHRLLSTVLRFKLLFQISDLNVLNRIEAKVNFKLCNLIIFCNKELAAAQNVVLTQLFSFYYPVTSSSFGALY